MNRRREANRAEAIVRGIGAIVMLLVLYVLVRNLPGMLQGKSTQEMMSTMFRAVAVFAGAGIAIGIIALVVWYKVRNRK